MTQKKKKKEKEKNRTIREKKFRLENITHIKLKNARLFYRTNRRIEIPVHSFRNFVFMNSAIYYYYLFIF
jgi:hypothetical protein